MQTAVIGLGYVGLVTAACLAHWGHRVLGVDVDAHRLRALQAGRLPFYEPRLDELVEANTTNGRLTFTSSPADAVRGASIVMVAVGTHDGNGGWQTDTIRGCLESILPEVADDATLVVRSTLPPEFIQELPTLIGTIRTSVGRPTVPVLINPEFTREGCAVVDFLEPERVVFGSVDDPDGRGLAMLQELYGSTSAPKLNLSGTDAAFAKLGSNLFLATKISFANELATLCEAYGADVESVVRAMAYDSRIGGRFLRAGAGFGGSCLPHQVTMTVRTARLAGIPSPLLQAVDEVNHGQRERVVEKLRTLLDGQLAGHRIAMLGVAFKPHTDDVRDAPSLTIAARLIALGAEVVAYDPMPRAVERASAVVAGIHIAGSAMEALEGADAVALVTEWPEFLAIDWSRARELMRGRAIVDARNVLSPGELKSLGFAYSGFGRSSANSPPQDARVQAGNKSRSFTVGEGMGPPAANPNVDRQLRRSVESRDLTPLRAGTSEHAIDTD
ncbi:MAG: UDP-glucose/GDP-mannose dehydrogenase family protein [Chloroflexota bacterium]|nr:UDP-glucose/GDP-mannose dehydrogenase family protein [Chloroflexota bacterium]